MTSSQKQYLVALAVLIAALVPIVYLNITLRRDCASLKKQLESANAAASSATVSNKPKANRPAPAIASSAGAPDNPEEIKERLEDIRGQNEQIRQDLDEQKEKIDDYQRITLDELERTDPYAYKVVLKTLKNKWERIQQKIPEQQQLLEELDASKGLIPDDELEVLRSRLVSAIKWNENELSPNPVPKTEILFLERPTPTNDPRLHPRAVLQHFCLAESHMEEDGLSPNTMDNLQSTLTSPSFHLLMPIFPQK